MARMIEIRALKRFRGPGKRMMTRGDTCVAQENFCAAKVRIGEAEYVDGPPPPIGFVQQGPQAAPRRPPKAVPAVRVAPKQQATNELVEYLGEDEAQLAEKQLQAMSKDELLDALERLGVSGFDRRYGYPRLRTECRKAAIAKIQEMKALDHDEAGALDSMGVIDLDDEPDPDDIDDDTDIED